MRVLNFVFVWYVIVFYTHLRAEGAPYILFGQCLGCASRNMTLLRKFSRHWITIPLTGKAGSIFEVTHRSGRMRVAVNGKG